ncbi:MAG: DnaD domain protein [Lachnospiraceae bacterium]|nr:DnaD domain protein [Lachnospiraceae bacterium]
MTLLSNSFIDHYMKDANDAQIKLYLYLLRTVNSGRKADLSVLSDFLNYTEKDILRALRYWERRGVLALSYRRTRMVSGDDFCGDELEGIRLIPLSTPQAQPAVHAEVSAPVTEGPARLQRIPAEETPAENPRQAAVRAVPQLPDPEQVREAYSLDELRAFKNSPETSWLITAAQQYLGRPLNPSQMRSLLFFSDALHMDGKLIDYLLQYCIGSGNDSFRYIEATALAWAEQGISDVDAARKQNSSTPDRETRRIMKLLGRSGNPAPTEQRLIRRWLVSYALPMEVIEEACNRAVLAVDANRFPYTETILRQWHEKGVRSLEDVKAADEAFRQSHAQPAPKRVAASAPRQGSSNFNNIEQQDYDFEELSKKLINNH